MGYTQKPGGGIIVTPIDVGDLDLTNGGNAVTLSAAPLDIRLAQSGKFNELFFAANLGVAVATNNVLIGLPVALSANVLSRTQSWGRRSVSAQFAVQIGFASFSGGRIYLLLSSVNVATGGVANYLVTPLSDNVAFSFPFITA